MTNLIKSHLDTLVSQDYLIKYNVKSSNLLPKLNIVVLSIKFNNLSKGCVVGMFEVIGIAKPYLTLSKVNTISLNLRKGDLVGAKLTLRKKEAFNFLQTFSFEILPYLRNNTINYKKKDVLHYQIKNIFVLESLNPIFEYFRNIKSLDIAIVIKNTKSIIFPLKF